MTKSVYCLNPPTTYYLYIRDSQKIFLQRVLITVYDKVSVTSTFPANIYMQKASVRPQTQSADT